MYKPKHINKWVEHNKKEYGVQIITLKEIINKQVEACGKSDEFTSDMLVALISGRKITEKMYITFLYLFFMLYVTLDFFWLDTNSSRKHLNKEIGPGAFVRREFIFNRFTEPLEINLVRDIFVRFGPFLLILTVFRPFRLCLGHFDTLKVALRASDVLLV